jgi:hypothetical protein
MELQQTHLDRTEQFAEWLENQRKLAGVDRKDLYNAGVVSESTYTKFVTIGNTRRKHGDHQALRRVPQSESAVFVGVLGFLAKATKRPELVAEGLSIWGMHEDKVEQINRASESTEYLGRIVQKLGKLPPDDLRTIDEIVSRFASV